MSNSPSESDASDPKRPSDHYDSVESAVQQPKLGIVGWLITLRATARLRRWVPVVASVLWVVAATVIASVTVAPMAAYDRLVPTGLGILAALPPLAGVVAVVQLWLYRVRR